MKKQIEITSLDHDKLELRKSIAVELKGYDVQENFPVVVEFVNIIGMRGFGGTEQEAIDRLKRELVEEYHALTKNKVDPCSYLAKVLAKLSKYIGEKVKYDIDSATA